MKTKLLFAAAIAAGLAAAPAAFAEDAMKPSMAKDGKMMDKKTGTMSKSSDKMEKPGAMMDKKDAMKDGMKK